MDIKTINDIFIEGQLPQSFGIELTSVSKESVKGSLTVDHRHLRPGNIMNGGVSLVLIETLGSVSSSLLIDWKKQNSFGIQVSANHIGVAKAGDVLTGVSKAIHVGKTTHVWEVSIVNQSGKLISNGRITMLVTETQKG